MAQDVPPSEPDQVNSLFGNDRRAWTFVYGFFLFHMLVFGFAGFFMSYGPDPDLGFNFLFSGFAIFVYIVFYLIFFGLDEMGWLFINSGLGFLGILAQLDWILWLFGSDIGRYPMAAHIIPAIYYVLYTFLLRRAIMHAFHAKPGTRRKRIIERIYVAGSLLVYVPLLVV